MSLDTQARSLFQRDRPIWLCWPGLVVLCLWLTNLVAADRPNIVIIYADDLGWGDLSSYGAQRISTPNIDRLAREGVRFTQFYSPTPVCSPARAALLTGRYPFRSGINRVLFPDAPNGLPSRETTLAEVLRQAGYRTGIFGKWHLGDRANYLPSLHGFDEYFGLPYSNDMHPLVFMRGDDVIKEVPTIAQLSLRLTTEAISFVKRNRDRPFFLYLSHAMPHTPIDATNRWKGESSDGIYGDVIEELDWNVGRLLDTLDELELAKDTIVFFSSDNGSWRARSNAPFRGKKALTWEGGLRVPLIVRYPGQFFEGHVSSLPSIMMDLMPTILDSLEIQPPPELFLDGRSLLPELSDRPSSGSVQPRKSGDPLFFFRKRHLVAVRAGDWKLHLARGGRWSDVKPILPELYNLVQDPGERVDQSGSEKAAVDRLIALVNEFTEASGLEPPQATHSQ